MASSLPVVVDDDLLRCRLCCRIAVEPKLLPCLHVFCGSCLDRHIVRVSIETDNHRSPAAKESGAASKNYKDKTKVVGEKKEEEEEEERKVVPGVDRTDRDAEEQEEEEEESYEIPQRTVDDDGYQIADESAFTGGSYSSNDNYYNQVTDAPANAYLEMTNKRNSARAAKNLSRTTGPTRTTTDQRVLRTFSECSGEYVPPGMTSSENSPGDLYDNVEDAVSSVVASQSTVDRKSDSPVGVRRWKVSSAVAPPMMVRKKKVRSGVANGDQSKGEDAERVTQTLSDRGTISKESLPAVVGLREDIYRDPEDLSPPLCDLYAADGSASSIGVYQLQKSTSDEYPGRISPIAFNNSNCQEKLSSPNAVENSNRIRGNVRKFNCPICEDLIRAKDGTKSLETCSFISALLDLSSFYTDDDQATTCKLCATSAPATHRCFDCRLFLCDGCKDGHRVPPGETRGHSVVSLTDLRTGKHQNKLREILSPRCRDHSEKTATYLCLVCKRIVCSECLSSSEHDEHWAAPVDEVSARERSYLESVVESVKERLETITDERKKLNNYRLRSDEDRISVMRDLIRQKETLIRLIETHSSMLLERAEQDFGKERQRIEAGLSVIDRVRFKMQSSLKFVDQLLEHGRPTDIFDLSQVVRGRLHALEALAPPRIEGRLAVGFHPTAIAADDIEQLFGVLTVTRPDQIVPPERDSSKIPRTEPQATMTSVTPKLLWAFPTKTVTDDKGCKPTGVALASGGGGGGSGGGDSEALVLVDDINKKLKIFRMDGILESEVFPTGEHRLIDPWDAVVLDGGSGDLAVTDRGAREVKIFRRSGEFVSSFGAPHLGNPWGIATNSLRNILVTDIVHRKVFVHDSAGRLVSSIPHGSGSGSDDRLRCPEYVAVNVNDDVIVSDFEQHCVIIFDKFGRFVARYGDRMESSIIGRLKVPCGVCVGQDGDIFVADYNNRRIVRLTLNGRLRCHYATNDSHLVKPQALAIDRHGRLVIVDRTHVKIFSVDPDRGGDDDDVRESKPKPKPRRKSEEQRGKHAAKKTPSAPVYKKREYPRKYSADRPGSAAAIETTDERERHDANDVAKPFLETEVW